MNHASTTDTLKAGLKQNCMESRVRITLQEVIARGQTNRRR